MGWIANAFLVCSFCRLRYKKRDAFIFGGIGNFLYIFVGLNKNMDDLAFINALFTGMNVWVWYKWGK